MINKLFLSKFVAIEVQVGMNRKEIVNNIARYTKKPAHEVDDILESFFSEVVTALTSGEDVSLRGFGTFTTKTMKKKKGHDFSTGKTIDIPQRRVPFLRFSKEVKI